eukprot:1123411-Amphidinium_carterae.1
MPLLSQFCDATSWFRPVWLVELVHIERDGLATGLCSLHRAKVSLEPREQSSVGRQQRDTIHILANKKALTGRQIVKPMIKCRCLHGAHSHSWFCNFCLVCDRQSMRIRSPCATVLAGDIYASISLLQRGTSAYVLHAPSKLRLPSRMLKSMVDM